jgi:hypothetical protein
VNTLHKGDDDDYYYDNDDYDDTRNCKVLTSITDQKNARNICLLQHIFMVVFVSEIQMRSKQLRVTYLLMSCFYGSEKNSMKYLKPDMFTTF